MMTSSEMSGLGNATMGFPSGATNWKVINVLSIYIFLEKVLNCIWQLSYHYLKIIHKFLKAIDFF